MASLFVFLFFVSSCSTGQNSHSFNEFVKDFSDEGLPLNVSPYNKAYDFFEISKLKEIKREIALNHLLGNDSSLLFQKSGGYYQFFADKKIILKNGLIGLIYYRPSFELYSGYLLAVYSKDYTLLSTLFIAGDYTGKSQMISQIYSDKIVTEEVIIGSEFPSNTEDSVYRGKKRTITYLIQEDGKFKKESEVLSPDKLFREDEDNLYWLSEF